VGKKQIRKTSQQKQLRKELREECHVKLAFDTKESETRGSRKNERRSFERKRKVREGKSRR